MARIGKTNAGTIAENVPCLKARGLKNPVPANYELDPNHPDMAMENDGGALSGKGAEVNGPGPQKSGKGGKAPASGKRTPGSMPGSETL